MLNTVFGDKQTSNRCPGDRRTLGECQSFFRCQLTSVLDVTWPYESLAPFHLPIVDIDITQQVATETQWFFGFFKVSPMAPHPPEPEPLPGLDEQFEERRRSLPGRPSVSSLASDIDSAQLRGVPLDLCLQGWGKHFHAGRKSNDYHLSKRVDQIDAFLSHDWKTGRWLKTLTLLLYFNSVPAAVASLLTCIVVCVLIIFKLLPGGWVVGTLLTHAAFWVIFAFWQRLRALFRSQSVVFLDRLCISQHDEHLKKEGILGLGGFLSKSQKLVVLWSPRYFTRLWTAFELASFLKHDQKRAKDIDFAPASMGALILCFSLLETMLVTCFHLLIAQDVQVRLGEMDPFIGVEEDRYWDFILAVYVIAAPALFIVIPVALYLGTKQMVALLELKKQLGDFKIRAAQCSCCELDHANPKTGEELLCDRELVFATLKRWFPDETAEGHLDKFDELVGKELGGFVRKVLGSGAPHLRFVLANTTTPLLGILVQYVYMAVNDPFDWTALGWMIGWFQIPPVVLLAFPQMLLCWRIGARFYGRVSLWLIFPPCMFLGITMNNLLWFQYTAIKYQFGFRFNWPVVGSLAFMWIVVAIPFVWEYSHLCPKRCRARSHSWTILIFSVLIQKACAIGAIGAFIVKLFDGCCHLHTLNGQWFTLVRPFSFSFQVFESARVSELWPLCTLVSL